ncbi:Fic/DOC family protein [Alkalimonas amylolytica]|uniref:Fic/DOC family protein n=2 Tax=Alkalimonas amylolytica TaxID=152573 RepID=A0A1H3X0U4_ALKAM|nr:Fic/DOC family protein [Alkalimonas amylolytica]
MCNTLNATKKIQPVYSYILRDYFYRYLAGDIVLREGRTVSRRQFIMAKSGIKNPDSIAIGVVAATQRFSDAVALLCHNPKIDMALLCEVNSLLRERTTRLPVIRSNPLQLQSACGLYQHDCPAPSLSLKITQQALSEFENTTATIEQLMALMASIINAHPFSDGNGRTTRAIFEAVCNAKQYPHLSPYIFVLTNNNMDELLSFHRSLCNDKFQVRGQKFLDNFLAWNVLFQQKLNTLLHETTAKISSKMLLMQTGNWFRPLLTSFWQNPIISVKSITTKTGDIADAKQGLDTLLTQRVLTLHTIANELCFVAEDILSLHEAIEAMLFANDNN